MKELSTDLDRDFAEIPSDPKFTRSFWKGFWLCVAIGFFGSIGAIWAELTFSKEIHDFFTSRIAFTVWLICASLSGVSWLVWRIKNKFY